MNDQAARILSSLVARYGTSIASDPLRCEGLLRDTCPRCSREIFVLINAVRQQVPTDLLSPRHSLPPALFRGFLVKRLQDELGLSDDAAHWAVDTWAAALGLDSGTDNRISEATATPDTARIGVLFPEDGALSTSTEQRAEWVAELESGSIEARLATIRHIAESQDRESARLLISTLENSSWKVRETAFDALMGLEDQAVPGLTEALGDPHEQVVVPCILLLGASRARAAIDPLLALLESGTGPKGYAVWALGEIGDDRAITPLTRLLNSDDAKLRSDAERALGKFR